MPLALSTLYRESHPPSPEALLDRLARFGVFSVVLDETLPVELARALLAALARQRGDSALVLAAVEHRSRARLCAPERDERQVAIENALPALGRAADAGAPVFIVSFGLVPKIVDEVRVQNLYARAEWDPARGDGGDLIEQRDGQIARAVDGARFALDVLVRAAEPAGLRLAFLPRQGFSGIPNLEEAKSLVEDFRGAPLGYWHDTAAAHREQELGLGNPEAWLQGFKEITLGARVADACGLASPLAPGTGEIDFTEVRKLGLCALSLPETIPADEVKQAIELLGEFENR